MNSFLGEAGIIRNQFFPTIVFVWRICVSFQSKTNIAQHVSGGSLVKFQYCTGRQRSRSPLLPRDGTIRNQSRGKLVIPLVDLNPPTPLRSPLQGTIPNRFESGHRPPIHPPSASQGSPSRTSRRPRPRRPRQSPAPAAGIPRRRSRSRRKRKL